MRSCEMTFEQAKAYAAGVRDRKQPVCDCAACRQAAKLSNVSRLVNNWKHLKARVWK
jgi:hypothetical protein